MHYRPFIGRAIAAVAVAVVSVLFAPTGCVAEVDSENVGEAASAIGCGLRGSCPDGYGCDYSDNTCHLLCDSLSRCDDGNTCTTDMCDRGLCYYAVITDGTACTVCGGSASGVCGGGTCRDSSSGLPIGKNC